MVEGVEKWDAHTGFHFSLDCIARMCKLPAPEKSMSISVSGSILAHFTVWFWKCFSRSGTRLRRLAGEEARKVQEQVNELIDIVLRFLLFSAIKDALCRFGMDCGAFLPPTPNLTEHEQLRLHRLLMHSEVGRMSFGVTF